MFLLLPTQYVIIVELVKDIKKQKLDSILEVILNIKISISGIMLYVAFLVFSPPKEHNISLWELPNPHSPNAV